MNTVIDQNIMQPDTWLSIEDVAAALKIHRNTVRRAIRIKELRATKIGKGWRIMPDAVQDYVKQHTNVVRPAA